MDDSLEQRVSALERALTDGEHDLSGLADAGAVADRIDGLESDIEDLSDRVAELEAATQALRGYVGAVRAVNREVEKRADAALAAATDEEPGSTAASADAAEIPRQRPEWTAGEQRPISDLSREGRSQECPHCASDGRSLGEHGPGTGAGSPEKSNGNLAAAGDSEPTEEARQAIRASRRDAGGHRPADAPDGDDPGLFGRIRDRL